MKKVFIIMSVLSVVSCSTKDTSLEKYVNPLIGTDVHVIKTEEEDKNMVSSEEKGQTMPAVGVPHGMTNWVAQTQSTELKCFSPYYYYQGKIQGFQASHWMNGSCTQNYGSVTVMPMTDRLEFDVDMRASAYSHENETATPSYYSVLLQDYDIFAEMTGLSRAAVFSFDFRKEGEHYIVVESNSDEGRGFLQIDLDRKEISGYNPVHRIYQGWGEDAGLCGYFTIRFDKDIAEFGVWDESRKMPGTTIVRGKESKVCAWIKFKSSAQKKLIVRIGTSFTSIENARRNLDAEIPGWDFDAVRMQSSKTWNAALGQIQVEGTNKDDMVKFYTALYETNFLPRTMSDIDGTYPSFDGGKNVMQMPNGETYYCDFSMWDTYRAVHPLFTILKPTVDGEMAASLILKGLQGGWLPIFPCWNNYTAAMIGDHSIAMIGDAIMKNIQGFDYETAYALMRKNAFEPNNDMDSYLSGKGRRALNSYLQYGYIPLEDEVNEAFHRKEQVSRTLEYAFDDFVLAQVAKKLGKNDDYNTLIKRAQNYIHVIDTTIGFARGRYADGRWIEPFDPFDKASFICEGTPYHYTWYVPQDVAGLIERLGGKGRFAASLNKFFNGDYYWHGNEPGHHIPYLYAYCGMPWKTQEIVHKIIEREYHTTPGGLSGNDDAGQMSAWLVFSMIGFYPICPGMPYYVIGSPSFDKITINLENDKTFTITAAGASTGNIYIQSASLNGKPYDKSYLLHDDIMNGGTLVLNMGSVPNRDWATSPSSLPPSLSK